MMVNGTNQTILKEDVIRNRMGSMRGTHSAQPGSWRRAEAGAIAHLRVAAGPSSEDNSEGQLSKCMLFWSSVWSGHLRRDQKLKTASPVGADRAQSTQTYILSAAGL